MVHADPLAACSLCVLQSPGLAGLRGVQDLSQLPDMQGLQKLAGRDDAHVLLAASNAPIQGTSADLLKAALIQLHQQLTGPPYCCRLMLTVRLPRHVHVPQAIHCNQMRCACTTGNPKRLGAAGVAEAQGWGGVGGAGG
jgi:hypothetical protein